jgi:hypothetical protein
MDWICLVGTSRQGNFQTPIHPRHPTADGARHSTDRRPTQAPMSTAGSRTASPCPSGRRRSGRDFPDLMVHMVEGVQPAQRGADPIRTHRRQGRGVATKSAGSAGGGEHDAGSFQLGLNPYPFDVTLRAGRVLPKLVWDVQHLAGLH